MMLQGKELILATKPFAQEDRRRSWLYTLSTALLLLLLLVGTIYNVHFIFKLICSILAGFVIVRLFVIFHDHQHKAILDKSLAARIFFTLFGFYVLAPSSIWTRSHEYHHRNNSKLFSASIGSFPVYSKKKFEQCSRRKKMQYLFIRHPLTIAFGYVFAFMYGMCIQSIIKSFKNHVDSLIALIVHFAYQLAILYFFGWDGWLLTCAIPHFISGGIGAYLFYAQHNFPGVTFAGNENWTYEGAAMDSSSYMELSWPWRWVTANIGYHHIHHLNARIPFYRLPEAMASIPELQRAKKTSLHPRDILACLRLKVWDYDNQQMVGLKG